MSALKTVAAGVVLLLSACASAPVPPCIPPELTREPETASGPVGTMQASANAEEYKRCKEREAEARLETQLRDDAARAKQREAEQLERELKEMQDKGQAPEPNR